MISRWVSLATAVQKFGLYRTLIRFFSIFIYKIGIRDYINEKGIGKIYLRRGTSDLPVYRQVFLNGEYEIENNFSPSLIIDLGANIGLFSLLMREKFPKSRIIAVEADPDNFSALKRNLRNYPEINCINAAIWNIKTKLKIDSSENIADWGKTVSSLEYEQPGDVVVDAITMNDLKKSYSLDTIDILKIDIEGAEMELFSSETEWLNDVRMVIIEFHDSTKKNSSSTFLRELSKHSNYSFNISGENVIVEFCNEN